MIPPERAAPAGSYVAGTHPDHERFWLHVNKTDGCWIWTGPRKDFRQGYGRFLSGRKQCRSHRYSWIMHYGPIPDGMCVLHKCDNQSCVRPDHLFLGTRTDNSKDMVSKRRHAHGERTKGAILTEEKVRQIRVLYAKGTRLCEIAAMFGIHRATASEVAKRRLWKHIP